MRQHCATLLIAGLLVIWGAAAVAVAQTTSAPAATSPARLSMGDLDRPESVVFMLTRRAESLPPGATAGAVRQQIDEYRAMAHDLKRRVGTTWADIEDFDRGRRAYLGYLAEAEQSYREIRRSYRGKTPAQEETDRALLTTAQAKLQQAARSWPDPLLRQFLCGVAELERGANTEALALFARCSTDAPRVAAFWQGRGMALAAMDRPIEALDCYNHVAKLEPGSPDAVELLRDGMRHVPGSQMRRDEYLEAVELADRFDSGRGASRTRGTSWLLPGGASRVTDFGLPKLPHDRLVFRQCVGTAVAENALLVDAETVADALEIYLVLPDGRIAPARLGRTPRRERDEPPIAVVSVEGYSFEPLTVGKVASAGQSVTVDTAPLYAEMGSATRSYETTLVAAGEGEGKLRLANGLAAGETTAPVVADGRLVGMQTGRTDVTAPDCGGDRFIPIGDLDDVVKAAERVARSTGRRREGAPRPISVQGNRFGVLAISGERITRDP
jgi:tetratricopeptide (TPR) repeat protein